MMNNNTSNLLILIEPSRVCKEELNRTRIDNQYKTWSVSYFLSLLLELPF